MCNVELCNNFLEFSIDSKSGGISKLFNKKTSTDYLKKTSLRTFYIWFLQTGKKPKPYANDDEPFRIYAPSEDTLAGVRKIENKKSNSIEVQHQLEDSVDVLLKYSLLQDSQLIFCEISIKNSSKSQYPGNIVAVGFPQIEYIRIGNKVENNILVRPNRFGEKIKDPIDKAGTYQTSLLYGGFASMMWMDLYSRNSGLYLASYDKTLLLTGLETIPNLRSRTITIGFRKYAYIPIGKSWTSEMFVIGIHEGDWHWAADRYREWANSWMVKPKISKELKLMDGWYGISFKADKTIKSRFKDIEKIYDEAQYLGLSHIQFWGQMVGDNCCYRFYYPDPRLGTIEELKSAIAKIKEKGGYIGFYFNIQAFSPYIKEYLSKRGYAIPKDEKIPDWLNEFKNYAQMNFDGSTTVQYPSRELENDGFRIMCTASKGWQEYILYWVVEKYLKEYGANFAYIDQAFSPPVSYCFNFEHGHEHHGCAVQGRVSLIKTIKEKGVNIDPNFAICIEGNGDSIGQFCDLHLYTSFSNQTKYPAPEIFAYTFPDYVIIDGFANPPVEWIGKCYYPDIEEPVKLEDFMNRVYLFGFRFDVTLLPLGTRIKKGDSFVEYVRKLIALRKKIKYIQYNSKFIDDLGVRCLYKKVILKAFKSFNDETLLINVLDYRKQKEPFTIKVDKSVVKSATKKLTAKMYTFEEELRLNLRSEKNSLLLEVPGFRGKVASIILS
ncbi:MAG: DUF6259 domain-containing protein [Thermoproteota archaeon]